MGVQRRTAWRGAVLVAVAATATGVLAGLASGDSGPSSAAAPRAADPAALGRHATWTTIFTATSGIEGLTGDNRGNVYVAERGVGSDPCPVLRIATATRAATRSGSCPDRARRAVSPSAPTAGCTSPAATHRPTTRSSCCAPGRVDRGDRVRHRRPGRERPRLRRPGHPLGQRRRQRRGHRLPDLAVRRRRRGGVPGPARWPTRSASAGRTAPCRASRPTRRPAEHRRQRDRRHPRRRPRRRRHRPRRVVGRPPGRQGPGTSPVGCDETFTADTLCLDAVRVEHPALEGADGIALDAAGRIWVDANERNTIAVVDQRGGVTEFFRNPVDPATGRRNAGRWSSRPARCSWASSSARRAPTAPVGTTSRTPPARSPETGRSPVWISVSTSPACRSRSAELRRAGGGWAARLYWNRTETLSRAAMRRIASANSPADETTSTLADRPAGWVSTLSVVNSRGSGWHPAARSPGRSAARG